MVDRGALLTLKMSLLFSPGAGCHTDYRVIYLPRRAAAGTDTNGRQKARKEQAHRDLLARAAKREKSKRSKPMTEASRDAAAKKCDPPRLDLGKIDLKKRPSKALLAAECETRGLPVKRKRGRARR